jgi:hypothetical protein
LNVYIIERSHNVLVDLLFNEETLELSSSIKVRFGIREGELRFNLENCSMPVEARKFHTRLKAGIDVKRTVKAGRKMLRSSESALDLKADASALLAGMRVSRKASRTQDLVQSDEFVLHKSQVSIMGEPSRPGWFFQAAAGEEILRGGFQKERLGTLAVQGRPFRVKVRFATTKNQLRITSTEGLPNFLSPDKRAVVRLLLVKLLFSKLNYGNISSWSVEHE